VRDEREACPLGKPRACDDRTLDHSGPGKPHGHTMAGHCANGHGRQWRPPINHAVSHAAARPGLTPTLSQKVSAQPWASPSMVKYIRP
jgi:hypothetical protein